jgi:CheY-like chemotaxis protein
MAEVKTFLLVEDEPRDSELVEIEFKQAPIPINLRAVRDGVEATDYVSGAGKYADRGKYPLPDVILLDVKMPRMNGFEFLQWLRSLSTNQHRLIPVVMMSSSGLAEDIDRAYALGANSYMVKPVSWQEFRERIKALGIYWVSGMETPKIRETGKECWMRI